jgi:hypothetical protein
VRAEDGDVPLAADRVGRVERRTPQAGQRLHRQVLAERADEAGPLDQVAVAQRGRRGEVAGLLEGRGHDRRGSQAQGLALQLLGQLDQQRLGGLAQRHGRREARER